MTLDPNLDFQLATEYVGGITLPVPSQIGHYARVDPTGINIEYVSALTARQQIVGVDVLPEETLTGLVAWVGIWNRALTLAEVLRCKDYQPRT